MLHKIRYSTPHDLLPIHSGTKYLGGHSDVLGGCLVTDLAKAEQLWHKRTVLGGVETLIEHPASMSHAFLSDQELEQAGIPSGLIRISVGIEDATDLIDDMRYSRWACIPHAPTSWLRPCNCLSSL